MLQAESKCPPALLGWSYQLLLFWPNSNGGIRNNDILKVLTKYGRWCNKLGQAQVKLDVVDLLGDKALLRCCPAVIPHLLQTRVLLPPQTHPIWTTAGNNPHEAEKACCQVRRISGRFRTCWLARHWSGDLSGSCTLPTCHLNPTPGTLTHILLECEDLSFARQCVYD